MFKQLVEIKPYEMQDSGLKLTIKLPKSTSIDLESLEINKFLKIRWTLTSSP